MGHIEHTFCTIEEYTAFEESRCHEAELAIDGLYMIMFALKSDNKRRQAAKKPGRVTNTVCQDSGLYSVEMTILNQDLTPDLETTATFLDGYWQREHSTHITIGNLTVKTGCLKSYYGALDDELYTLISESVPETTSLEQLEPVLA